MNLGQVLKDIHYVNIMKLKAASPHPLISSRPVLHPIPVTRSLFCEISNDRICTIPSSGAGKVPPLSTNSLPDSNLYRVD